MIDAHLHINSVAFLELLKRESVDAIACGTDPDDARRCLALIGYGGLRFSFGLHPWKADRYKVEEMLPYFDRCRILGEIGMDSEWCTVPLEKQEKVFAEQLCIAEARKMPVILHTKGQEKRILELIRPAHTSFLVHWYDCENYLDDYLALGCYFTLGPCAKADDPVLQKVPKDRILIESDGIGAIAWKQDTVEASVDYLAVMERSRSLVAARWGLSADEGESLLNENFRQFLCE